MRLYYYNGLFSSFFQNFDVATPRAKTYLAPHFFLGFLPNSENLGVLAGVEKVIPQCFSVSVNNRSFKLKFQV